MGQMELNLKNLLTEGPTRLRYVDRFSTCRTVRAENVAEHSFYVCLYALFVARWVNSTDPRSLYSVKKVDIGKILERSVMHDLDEAVTGDMPRSFKHSDERLLKVIEEHGALRLNDLLAEILDWNRIAEFHDMWSLAKDESNEGRILAFADFLSVLSYIYEESKTANRRLIEHVDAMEKYFKSFNCKEYNFLAPLIHQAGGIFKEVIDGKVS